MQADDVYERIKEDITEFLVFRFDWFFKSRFTAGTAEAVQYAVGDD